MFILFYANNQNTEKSGAFTKLIKYRLKNQKLLFCRLLHLMYQHYPAKITKSSPVALFSFFWYQVIQILIISNN